MPLSQPNKKDPAKRGKALQFIKDHIGQITFAPGLRFEQGMPNKVGSFRLVRERRHLEPPPRAMRKNFKACVNKSTSSRMIRRARTFRAASTPPAFRM